MHQILSILNFRKIIVLTTLSIVLLSNESYSQHHHQHKSGILPSLVAKKALTDKLSLNAKWETRHYYRSSSAPSVFDYQFERHELSFSVSRKIMVNSALAGGYILILKENKYISRIAQQFTTVNQYSNFRLAHRISADQTFETEGIEVRFRYRITPEIPLMGNDLNPKEFYLKVNNEYLHAFQNNLYYLEVRLSPLLGFNLNKKVKLEVGPEYRGGSLNRPIKKHTYFISLNGYFKI